jgi:hypothetical protein
MIGRKGTRSSTELGSPAHFVAILLMIVPGAPALWSQTFPTQIGVEVADRQTGFIDALKDQGRLFLNTALSANAPIDSSGWPTTDGVLVVFDNRPVPVWTGTIDDPAQDQPNCSGWYTMSFNGQATLGSVAGNPTLTFANQTYTNVNNENLTTVNVYLPGGPTYADGPALMVISFTNTIRTYGGATNTGVTGVQVIRPGFTLAQAANPTTVFDPVFLNALQPFSHLRVMQWLVTTTNPYYGTSGTPTITWSTRSLPTDEFQGLGVPIRVGAWGMSWEYILLLANAANKDIWINIPVNATGSPDPLDPTYDPSTGSYVYQLALLLKNGNAFTNNVGLNPGLHIYIEHSNEVWNSAGGQDWWNEGAAAAEGCNAGSPLCNDGDTNSLDWAYRRHIKRVYEIGQIFASVFGPGSLNTTIRPVYAWWQLDEGTSSNAANALAWFKNTYGAPSNYMYGMAQGDYFTPANWANDTTVDDVLQDFQSGSEGSTADIAYVENNYATASQYGLKLLTYEGGPDNSNSGTQNTTNVAPQIEANRTYAAQNGGLGIDLLLENHVRDNWFPYGGSNFGIFQLSGAYSRYGDYGLTDDLCNLQTAKYSAALNLTGYAPAVPPAPSLSAVTASQSVTLNWPPVTGAANYTVERSTTSGGPYTTLGTACTPTYLDTAVSNGTTYYYVVAAVNAVGQQTLSSQLSATPSGTLQAPGAPGSLTASAGNGQVLLSWNAPTTGGAVTNYQVWDSTGGSYSEANSAVTSTSYTVSGLTNGTQYSFYVTASNSAGTSGDSNTATATPTASQQSQTISFTQPITPVAYGVSPITLLATATSGLAVTFSVSSGPGTISGNALTVTGVGTIVVAANQAGNSSYSAAPQVARSIVVNQASQSIDFTTPTSPVTYPISPITLQTTATSGLAVTFSVVSGQGTVSGSTLTVTGTGTIVVAANQAGNADYAAASQVTQSVVVNAAGSGTLLAYEPFGETSGSTIALNGVSGGGDSGWGAAWVEQSGSTAIPGYNIVDTTPLTYSGLQTTENYAIGGYGYQSAGRQLNVSSGGPFNSYLSNGLIGASGQTVWLSFLIREDVNNGNPNAIFLNNSAGSPWVPGSTDSIGIGYFGGSADWGLQYSNGTPVLSSVAVVEGRPTLLVVSVTFGATNVINLYVSPTSLGGSAPSTPSATLSTTGSVAFDSLAFVGGYGTNNSSLADIRFGTTYAAVTPTNSGQESQTISFTAPTSPVTYGVSPITLSATASSGLEVTFSVVSGPGAVSGNTLTVTGAGTIVVAANQAGNSSYSAAPQVTQNVVVNQASQSINFTAPSSPVTYPVSPITLQATATSGLSVTFGIVSGPGTVSGSTLTVAGTGTIVVAANQVGNANYSAASQVTQSVVVNAGSGGGALLAYEPFGETSGSAIALNGASGGGDSGWGAAWVEQSGSTAIPGYDIVDTTPLTYSGLQTTGNYAIGGYGYQSVGRQLNVSSGGPFNSYLSSGLIGASGTTVWLSFLIREDMNNGNNAIFLNNNNSGSSWVPGSTDSIGIGYFGGSAYWGLQYSNGTPVLSSVPVTQGQPTLLVAEITFGSTNVINLFVNPASLGGSAPSTPSATFSTTGSVAFQSLAYTGGYSTNNSSLADIRFGTSYAAVTPTSLASQTINFTAPTSPVTYGISPITLQATATSGLAITFSVVSGPGTVSGNTLTVTGAGTIVVAANQAGNGTYSAAPQVTQNVVVNQASQTINFTAPTSPVTYPASPITLSATASSGLAVAFSVVSGPGTVSGSTLTVTGTGTIVVAANQAGNGAYSAAPQVTQSVVVIATGGALLAYEPFGETSGSTTALNGASGGGDSGWGTAWVEQSGSTAIPGYDIVDTTPLTYTGLQTTANYAIGGYAYQSAGRQLNLNSGGPFNSYLSNGLIGASGTTIWLSFLSREDVSNGTPNEIFLSNNGGSSSWVPGSTDSIGIGYFGGTADWGLQYSGGTPVLSNVAVVQGQPTLLVVSISFGATNVINLYVNPTSLGGSAPSTPSATISTTGSVAFASLAYMGGYNTDDSSLADIRFGTTYSAVTP